jgi:hypothetical protein
MSEKTQSKATRTFLPFSVPSVNRKELFTREMEKTAIFCYAELDRARGGGLILKQPAEKIAFISEFCYPFWFIPWGRLNLLFDGLSATAHTMTYSVAPDAQTFTENIERSSKALEVYTAFLSDSVNYFQTTAHTKEVVISGLITDQGFLNEFAAYLNEATLTEISSRDFVVLSPTLEESTIYSAMNKLESLKSEFKEEIDSLYACMKLLNNTTRGFTKTIRGKIKIIREEFGKEIKKQEEIIKPKVDSINAEYDEKITKLAKDTEKQLLPLQKEKVKLEKIKEQTHSKIERYKMEAKTSAAKKDTAGERKWKEKANEGRKELSETEAAIKEVNGKIKGVEETNSLETIKLKSEWEAKTKEASKDLLELEASRDAKTQLHKDEIERLEKTTSTIIEQISKMAKMREASLLGFEKLGTEQKQKENMLVYVPFYMVCYQSESRRRYVVFPPSVANSISFLTRLRGALGRTKIRQLLVSRFKITAAHLEKFPSVIERNAVFEREINEAGDKTSILEDSLAKEQIKSGLEKLKEEGWLSEKEYGALTETYSKIYG